MPLIKILKNQNPDLIQTNFSKIRTILLQESKLSRKIQTLPDFHRESDID